jgi:hypothetical protein
MSDQRKLRNIQHGLEALKQDLLPNETSRGACDVEVSNGDAFQRLKNSLSQSLHQLTIDIERARDLPDGRSTHTSIRLHHENDAALRKATENFSHLQAQQTKDETNKAVIKRMGTKQLAERRELCRLLGMQLQSLVRQASVPNSTCESKEENDMRARVDARRAAQEALIQQKRALRKARGHEHVVDVELHELASPQELAFQERVDVNRQAQDDLLQQISVGLDQLSELAHEANRQLVVQDELLGQVNSKMDRVIVKFKSANRRLKDMLEESGGCTRWCPLLVLVILLLALIGYLLHSIV